MGNTLGSRRRAKIMKINGETIKFKTPIQVREVVKGYPGHVLLDSEAVKQYGIRAKPLDQFYNLESKKLYFLVELPKFPQQHNSSGIIIGSSSSNSNNGSAHHEHRVPRRVMSGIHMSAKDRLESLMLSRRSVSDLSIMGPATRVVVDGPHEEGTGAGVRVRVRLPKAEVERLMSQSRDQHEMANKIVDLCKGKTGQDPTMNMNNGKGKEISNTFLNQPSRLGNPNLSRARPDYKKRVGFLAVNEGVAAAS